MPSSSENGVVAGFAKHVPISAKHVPGFAKHVAGFAKHVPIACWYVSIIRI